MNFISAKKPVATPTGGVDLLATFAELGEIPFHATPDSPQDYNRDLYQRAMAGEFGAIAPCPAAVNDPVPPSVTMRQARLALLQAGLLTQAEAAVANMAGDAGDRARIEWEYAQEIQRDWPTLTTIAGAMGLTNEEIDNLFTLAATL
ncbi:hypothetical protein Despr_2419 [Desulfobulbus propionicus DSM 2032]|uniref:Uncharacterized protein n=1 Tax=Desulfobulbus propionicus (strain ATCC 33891 / DSM 2032 / VKM B-1956 / 1pr3) TaxID=577650 RepID=A0A7U3YNC2_DESPD|nr:hypothetical protein [Desulfobulbus propionicus]ADW16369.1 hypothetical protein Despr_0180 [Desulfobulbus propionicus DSM 2032]ADW18560.1 hypothetical protein Despr_2419 [Desulfobulbus propionicus DSM 2032]